MELLRAWSRRLHGIFQARPHYEKALHLAETVQPVFQEGWAPPMQAKLAAK